MNIRLLASLVLAAACASGPVGAQTGTASPAPEAVQPAPVAPVPASVPNQTVYSARLPGVNELSAAAAAQGLTIDRIEQTAAQVTAVYRNASGQTTTVAYLILPGASVATAGTPAATGTVAVPASPAPKVVYYEPAPRVVYYEDYAPAYYYGYPRYWGPPVSIGLGFGFRSGGYYRGGFHGGHGGFHGRH
ncbi:MAG: hypothetical protein NTV51_16545 [Verrucomicrobia bacterium]|nr:hypothetical protein [Verrucomicrobiota bacterium]